MNGERIEQCSGAAETPSPVVHGGAEPMFEKCEL